MSIIHLNQIKNHISRLFLNKIDMSDTGGKNEEDQFLTRALAAYAVHFISQTDPNLAGAAVTDGGNDNGLDAVYYDERERRLYLVQSKWIKKGRGEPDYGAIKKFIGGVTDLFNLRFDKFNSKIRSKRDDVLKALNDPYSRYSLVVVYTSVSGLADPAHGDLQSLVEDLNDASEVVEFRILKQQDLHKSLTVSVAGDPINIDIQLRHWGKVDEPFPAYYGQVCATQIADWWSQYHTRLFANNLRSLLGDTEINAEIRQTMSQVPELFWYFNNGITIVSHNIVKSMAHGTNTDVGSFTCEKISIVNGAQTVGTIGRFSESPLADLEKVNVPVRLISIGEDNEDFGKSITRSNNRQNRIENRDFVALDPEQTRLKTELAIEGVTYHIMRAEGFEPTDKSFDLAESTIALACASGKGGLVVQLKREIGRLWEDIDRAPYRELFNPQVSGVYIWRIVKVQRLVDSSLDEVISKGDPDNRRTGIVVHGNRIICSLVFSSFEKDKFHNPDFDFETFLASTKIDSIVREYIERLTNAVERHFSNSIIPTLFKNRTKCENLLNICKKEESGSSQPLQFNLFDWEKTNKGSEKFVV